MHGPDALGRLLGIACNPATSERQARLLADAARSGVDWQALPQALAIHRLGPLLHWQFRQYGIRVPTGIRRLLAGMYAREQYRATARTEALREIADQMDTRGIDFVVLKGGVLAHSVYAEPGLRPMDDLDILVSHQHLASAQQALETLGLHAPAPANRYQRIMHHLPLARGERHGVPIQVEIHRSVMNAVLGAQPDLEHIQRPLTEFCAGGRTLRSLHPEEFLTTQWQRMGHLNDTFRAIRLADLAGLAETSVSSIDWAAQEQRRSGLRQRMHALQEVTPLSRHLCEALQLDPDHPPGGADPTRHYYRGWPLFRFSQGPLQPVRGTQLLQETLLPPSWWMRLTYGTDSPSGLAAAYGLRHPFALAVQTGRRLYMGPVCRYRFFRRPV